MKSENYNHIVSVPSRRRSRSLEDNTVTTKPLRGSIVRWNILYGSEFSMDLAPNGAKVVLVI